MRNLWTHLVAFFLIPVWAGAAVIHVPGDVPRIKDAIAMANNGDTVILAEGVYEDYFHLLGKNLTVTGSNPDDWEVVSRTIFQPPTGYTGPVVQFGGSETAACVLTGLTIQKGVSEGGIRGNNTHATISRCWVRNNSSNIAGGIFSVAGVIDRCRITGNTGTVAGGIVNAGGIISNCLIADNRGGTYGGAMHNCAASIMHCTIVNNSTGAVNTPAVSQNTGMIANCIVWGNTTINGSTGTPTVLDLINDPPPFNSCFSKTQGQDINGNIYLNPQLGPGYSLMAGSPCIDAGTNTPPIPLAGWDLRGANRVVDGDDAASVVTDMGAFEFDPLGISIVTTPERLEFGAAGGVAGLPVKTFEVYNLDGGTGSWQIDKGDCAWVTLDPDNGQVSQTAQTISVQIDPAGLEQGEYTCNLAVMVDGTSELIVPVVLHVGRVIRVPQDIGQIQAAIQMAADCDTIIVSPGTYKENLDFLGKKIIVRSADPQDWNIVKTTIVDGRCISPCVTFAKGEGRESIVEGLTLQLGGGTVVNLPSVGGYMGGGIFCQNSSPTIRRCSISWNGYGSYPSPGQWPPYPDSRKVVCGGGIALIGSCQTQIEDCLLVGNVANSRGAAFYAAASVGFESQSCGTLERCTIAENIPSQTGAPGYYDVDCTATKTKVANTLISNTRNTRSLIIADTEQVRYCCMRYVFRYPGNYGSAVQEEITGKNGNITGDPHFISPYNSSNPTVYDYRLKATSPCIDHGDPAWEGETRDLAGNERLMNGRLDMGAFEFVPEIRVVHPMEGDVWAAGSRHEVAWTEYQNQPVVVNPGFELSYIDTATGGKTTTKDIDVPGWTIGPNSGVAYMPEKFDSLLGQGVLTGFDRGSGVYQLLVDSYRPNCRYSLKLFVGRRKDAAVVTNWQAALTAGDRETIISTVTQENFGVPNPGKWIAATLIVETGAEGEDANVGKRIGVLLTGLPLVDFDDVSLNVEDLAPTATVDVELSTDDGQTWQTLADALPDTGSFAWTISSDLSGEQCRIRAASGWPDFIWVPSELFSIRPYQAGGMVESRWPTEGHDMQRTGLTGDNGPELGCVKWQYTHPAPIAVGAVIGIEDRVYVGGDDGKLIVLDSTGQVVWTYSLATPLTGEITIGADGTAYVGDRAGDLYAIDPAGQLRWKHQTSAMIAAAPAVTEDGKMIFGSVDGTIVALGADGSELWTFAVPGPGKVGGAAIASPTIGRDGNVYVGGLYDGKLYALASGDGQIVWTCDFTGGTAGQNLGLANAPAVAADGTIYATRMNDTNLYAIDPNDGEIVWATNLAGTAGGNYGTDYPQRYKDVYPWASPTIGPDGTIYVAFDDPYLRAVNPDGTLRWARRLGMVGGFTLSVGANGKIYAACDDHSLYVLNPEGTVLSRFDGSNWLSWPVIGVDETLYISDFAGTLWAISPQPCDGQLRRLARPADITLDGMVRLEDLADLAKDWKECTDSLTGSPCVTGGSGWKRNTTVPYLAGDIDRDTYVGLSDLLAIAEKWMAE